MNAFASGKKIVLGITGSIAASKSAELLRLLVADGHEVRVVMTPSARHFVDETILESLSGQPPAWQQFPRGAVSGSDIEHIELSRFDLMLIAPATANTIGKMAAGIADNLLLSTYLAFAGEVVFCPAMNQRMWLHPAVQENVERISERGAVMVPPATGRLACGEEGPGRMAEPSDIMLHMHGLASGTHQEDLDGLRLLVTAGGTREPIDAVRYVANRSSGKMGLSIAEAAFNRGAKVTLVAANCDMESSPGIRRIDIGNSDEMFTVLKEEFEFCDVLIMAAAVSDYKVSSAGTRGKLEKDKNYNLQLVSTIDIVSSLDNSISGQMKVGFAAEYGQENISRAGRKLREKNLDMIVFNDISRNDIGFESDFNEVTMVTPDEEDIRINKTTKLACANAILDQVAKRFS
jgi:phosphopantothenoylcysteine decarboxylase/phosphopantothenate--cysteine ligase